jgi:hypothetical protein
MTAPTSAPLYPDASAGAKFHDELTRSSPLWNRPCSLFHFHLFGIFGVWRGVDFSAHELAIYREFQRRIGR